MLERFFSTVDFGAGLDFYHKNTVIRVDRFFVDERIRLMRLNAAGAKKEGYGLAWYEVLLAVKESLNAREQPRQD